MNLKEQLGDIGEESIKSLEIFVSTLKEWNSIHNLSGARDERSIIDNILDSLYPLKFISTPDRLLDVGTGAGFPGLVLASVLRDSECVLCEPLKKRSAFLRFCAMEMGLDNVQVVRERVEEYQDTTFPLITSRAVTDTKLLLKLTNHLSDKDTEYLFYKGSRVQEELKDLKIDREVQIVDRGNRRYLYLKLNKL